MSLYVWHGMAMFPSLPMSLGPLPERAATALLSGCLAESSPRAPMPRAPGAQGCPCSRLPGATMAKLVSSFLGELGEFYIFFMGGLCQILLGSRCIELVNPRCSMYGIFT